MGERLLGGGGADCVGAPGAEGPPRGGERHALDALDRLAAERLKDRIVLAVDRQEPGANVSRGAHEGRAGADEAFLVGESDSSAPRERGMRRLYASGTGDGAEDQIGGPPRRFHNGLRAGGNLDPGAGKFGF